MGQEPPRTARAKYVLVDLLLFPTRPLPKNTPIAFLCHHGTRSRSAAEHFVSQGFSKIYNVEGGIDAWSVKVDPTVPRY